jgi:hypothetical protein
MNLDHENNLKRIRPFVIKSVVVRTACFNIRTNVHLVKQISNKTPVVNKKCGAFPFFFVII